MHIRDATSDDAIAIAELAQILATHEAEQSLCDAGTVLNILQGEAVQGARILVSHTDDRLTGFVFFYPGYDLSSATTGYHVADMCVHPKVRRNGVGRALMRGVAQAAFADNRCWVSLTMLQTNDDAASFYAALQFSEMPVRFLAAGESVMAGW